MADLEDTQHSVHSTGKQTVSVLRVETTFHCGSYAQHSARQGQVTVKVILKEKCIGNTG